MTTVVDLFTSLAMSGECEQNCHIKVLCRLIAALLVIGHLKCRLDKERENAAALEVFSDLLGEIDAMSPKARLTALIEGVLAANIFDWGARACVDLYHQGTIMEIYRF